MTGGRSTPNADASPVWTSRPPVLSRIHEDRLEAHAVGPLPEHGEAMHVEWHHPTGMWGLAVINTVLRVLTLGVYDFWGRTEVRRRIWSAVRINGQPLTYSGTGGELCKGFMIIFGVLLLPLLILTTVVAIVLADNRAALSWLQFLLFTGTLYLSAVAYFRAQRYRFSRTSWRGIRFGLSGNSWEYGWTSLWMTALVPFTLGWILPFRSKALQWRISNGTRFGSEPMKFTAKAGPLYPSFALMWLGVGFAYFVGYFGIVSAGLGIAALNGSGLPEGADPRKILLSPEAKLAMAAAVFGAILVAYLIYAVITAWYRAKMFKHFAQATTIGDAQFFSSVTGRGFAYIALTNFLIKVCSMAVGMALFAALALLAYSLFAPPGIESSPEFARQIGSPAVIVLFLFAFVFFLLPTPVTEARSMGYIVRNLALTGAIDLEAINQRAADDRSRGEGLASAFDIDAL